MKDIKQRIQEAIRKGDSMETVTTNLIEEIIKPIAKEAFEAGEENKRWCRKTEEWISEYKNGDEWFKSVTSNKQ